MAETDPLSDIFTLLAAPLAGTIKSVEQFRRGVDEFLAGVENFNRTMENLNETAERINTMLGEVEEPLRAAIPQVTRTVQAADEVMAVMSGPAKAVAPGLARLAEVLETPAFAQMPGQITQVSDVLGELTARLAPLGQLAESAGGLFGGVRLPGFGAPPRTAASGSPSKVPSDAEPPTVVDDGPTTETASTPPADDESAGKKSAAKKSAAKKTAAKKSATKSKAAAKKSAPKRTATKKSGG